MRSRLASSLVAYGIALAVVQQMAHADDELAKELPRIKGATPEEALKRFRLHDGFHLETLAAEPLLSDPVSACYDADGRLYVAEMRDYPFMEGRPGGLVRRLEDKDGDGRFDDSKVFLDKLPWPTGVVPYDGGIFIAVAPDIIYAKDTDGDGVADVRKIMFSGFEIGNVQGLVNGLLWGTDGWIYGVAASNGGEIRNVARPDQKPVSVRGRDFRFKPDGSAFESISGGGQFGHSFDDWGHRFTCNNSNHIRQIVLDSRYLERNPALIPPPVILDIPAEGPAAPVFRISGAEPWRIVRTRQRAADPAIAKRLPRTELFAIGFFTSATGVTIYRGSAYPKEYRGNAFIGDVGGNLVHRKTVAPNGSTFLATRADQGVEFLASTDNWFRPVNFLNTPDGTLLILDMYRETIEHPASIPEPIKKHLDLTSGKDRGRLYELVHDSSKRPRRHPALSKASTAELVAHLADPEAWWRETAQRLLIERKDHAAAPGLKEMVRKRPSAQGRLHALWTLNVLGDLDPADLMLGLEDGEPRVREQSVKLCDSRVAADASLRQRVIAMAGDADPMVRLQVAFTLGEASADAKAIDALAAIAVKDSADPWIRAAVLSSVANRAPSLLAALARTPNFFATPAGRNWLDDLSILIGAGRKPAEIEELLKTLAEPGIDRDLKIGAVLGLARGLKRSGGSLASALAASSSTSLKSVVEDAAELAEGEEPVELRVPAIQLLGLADPEFALKVVPPLLDARQAIAIQLAAIQALTGLADRSVGRLILDQWKSMSPGVRREAVEALFARRERLSELLDALDSQVVAPGEIDPARLQELRTISDRKMRQRAVRILGAESTSAADRAKAIAAFRPALSLAGNPERGREVFLKTCATCHLAENRGVEVGPNLATITGRSPEDLLIHILDPNREVPLNYVNYTVATSDGRVVSGIIAEESAAAMVLKRAEGAEEVIARGQIEAVKSTGLSLMPEGLEKGLSPQDMANLITYLKSLQPNGVKPGESAGAPK